MDADTVAVIDIDIDLVVSDLDGTLWRSDHDLPARTRDAIAELDRRGVPLLIATGTRLQSTATPLRSFGLTPPAVMLNGALGIDLATHIVGRAADGGSAALIDLPKQDAEGLRHQSFLESLRG